MGQRCHSLEHEVALMMQQKRHTIESANKEVQGIGSEAERLREKASAINILLMRNAYGIGSEAERLREEGSAMKKQLQDKEVEMAQESVSPSEASAIKKLLQGEEVGVAQEVMRLKELMRRAQEDRAASEHRIKLAGADVLAAKEGEASHGPPQS
ncbi:hypothetical protein T484DRAFT_1784681 [Baffinella frigidus]|nr:hypothetical protein T484DRAFT_1784681 [Cryptophyta sp. CCMP2293]